MQSKWQIMGLVAALIGSGSAFAENNLELVRCRVLDHQYTQVFVVNQISLMANADGQLRVRIIDAQNESIYLESTPIVGSLQSLAEQGGIYKGTYDGRFYADFDIASLIQYVNKEVANTGIAPESVKQVQGIFISGNTEFSRHLFRLLDGQGNLLGWLVWNMTFPSGCF